MTTRPRTLHPRRCLSQDPGVLGSSQPASDCDLGRVSRDGESQAAESDTSRLRDAGYPWDRDRRRVRFVFCSMSALGAGLGRVGLTVDESGEVVESGAEDELLQAEGEVDETGLLWLLVSMPGSKKPRLVVWDGDGGLTS